MKIKILERDFKIEETSDEAILGNKTGVIVLTKNEIYISQSISEDEKPDVILHEFIEFIDWSNNLNLSHQQISTLGMFLNLILRELNINLWKRLKGV